MKTLRNRTLISPKSQRRIAVMDGEIPSGGTNFLECGGYDAAFPCSKKRHRIPVPYYIAITCFAALTITAVAQPTTSSSSSTPTTTPGSTLTTPTEELTDNDWQTMSDNDRRQRWRRRTIASYLPDGAKPLLADVQEYTDKFGERIVYDPRYYLYKVTATPVPDTTGSVVLSGEVYPANYREGVADLLDTLGFNIEENNIVTLPELSELSPYALSTTSAATVRKEPRRNSEQLNSVARGGWARVLRPAAEADITTRRTGYSRHAPGAEKLPEDSAGDWMMVQTMEGYIGFARKSDFELRGEYRLPDGMVTLPTTLADSGTTLPAGIFVYGDPQDGWNLFHGEKLAANAPVTDLRPAFSADNIIKLMKPFMNTSYVWGGVTDEGIDCSGFSQFFMRTAGAQIPRDAVQQATSGLIVAWGRDVLDHAQPGDLIFFARDNGRISHVAISLGGSKIIHSAGPGVHFSDLNDPKSHSDEAYADSILFARRIATR